jgi:hypothetical protein
MRMLLGVGVTMRSMEPKDWSFLVSLCDADVQAAFSRRGRPGSPFSRIHMSLRRGMDRYLAHYIVSDWTNPPGDGAPGARVANAGERASGEIESRVVDMVVHEPPPGDGTFLPSDTFVGARPGYVFTTRDRYGTGYYLEGGSTAGAPDAVECLVHLDGDVTGQP